MERALLIGEIGLSHEGSLGSALSMIKASKKADLDYVKFQFHKSEYESTSHETFRINTFPQDKSRSEYWDRTSFKDSEWVQIIEYCKLVQIGFLCTPFSVWAAKKLIDFGVTEVKISSGDANNWELLEFAKKNFQRMFISIGMSTKSEVNELISFMENYDGEFIILQCTSDYPVKPIHVGLNYFNEILARNGKVGLSDHTGNPLVSITAVANQASVVEFHVVFSKEQFGPDSGSSITFDEASLVSSFRNLLPELYDSNYDKDLITEQLFEVRSKFGRGLALKENLPKGNLITEDMLTLKKPLGPLTWNDRKSVIGKKANKDLKSWNHLNLEDFD
jgi:N-acetylneuraminate synthase